MAHEIEIFNGKASFFSVREEPWHKLGTIIREPVKLDQALVLAGLDWETERADVTAVILTSDGVQRVEAPGYAANVRKNPETGEFEVLGIVSTDYKIVSNRQALGFLDDLVDQQDGAHFETAGSLRGGKRVFATIRLPDEIEVQGLDGVDRLRVYLLVTTSHDGSMAITCAVTIVRVVCMNTLNYGLSTAHRTWTARHTSGVEGRIQEARETLGLTFKYVKAFEAEAATLAQVKVNERTAIKMIDRIWPVPDPLGSRSKTNYGYRRDTIMDLFQNADTQAMARGTGWGFLQAATEYLDYFGSVRGGDEGSVKRRAERMMLDPQVEARKTEIKDMILAGI